MKIFKASFKAYWEKSGYTSNYVVANDIQDAKQCVSHSQDTLTNLVELQVTKIPLDNWFHRTATEYVLYRDLIPGDLVFETGCLFKLNAVWSSIWDNGKEVVRCDDVYVPEYPGNKNIPYWAKSDVVGAAGKEQATIVRRCVNPYLI